MSRLITKKYTDQKNLAFAPMGSKPGITKVTKKVSKKKKTKTSPFAKRAAMALAKDI